MMHSDFLPKETIMILCIIFILPFLVTPTFAAGLVADSIDNYPVVCDARNFKAATGGKSTKPQGIPLYDRSERLLIGKKFLDLPDIAGEEHPWRYMVTMNCKKGSIDDLVLMVKKLATQLLPPEQCHRLAILIGINEKLSSFTDLDVPFDWSALKAKRNELEALGIPILFVYTPWSTYREGPEGTTALDIIKNIKNLFDGLNKRQADALRKTIKAQDDKHGFPFGAMRTHLLKNEFTNDFVSKFSREKPVYYHIQDSDFTSLQTFPQFYTFGVPTETSITSVGEKYLYAKYDSVISAMQKRYAFYPVIVGGAHVYDPDEVLDNVGVGAKQWTRFASEMGNMIKHILAVFQPYGVYPHEPNTMCLAPQTVQYLHKSGNLHPLLSRLKTEGITFGMDCEVQDFIRALFRGLNDNDCRKGMIFAANLVLATSMKRAGRPFNIKLSGNYDQQAKKFQSWKSKDIKAIHGMPQEIIDPNAWMCNVSTSFSAHRKVDRRTLLCTLFSAFDPHALSGANAKYAPSRLYEILVGYEGEITRQKPTIKETFQNLLAAYDELGQGNLTAFYILSAAWEAGQTMRIMFLDNLEAPPMPAGRILAVPNVTDIRKLLADRLNYKSDRGHPFPNAQIISLLDLDGVPRRINVSDMLVNLVKAVYKQTKTKKKTGEIIGMSAAVVSGILKDETVSPTTRNKYKSRLDKDINVEFPDLPEPARLTYLESIN
ncbi:MAG: hypothetical protein WCN27_01385 [Alphaproteobacteria bacterium]